MTVSEYTSNSLSCRNPIGMGKSTTHDAPETRDGAIGGSIGSTNATKPVAVADWFGL